MGGMPNPGMGGGPMPIPPIPPMGPMGGGGPPMPGGAGNARGSNCAYMFCQIKIKIKMRTRKFSNYVNMLSIYEKIQ